MDHSHHPFRYIFIAGMTLSLTACADPYYSQEMEDIAARSDFTGAPSIELCDAASYFTYDASPAKRPQAQRILAEVLKRGDIRRSGYNSALTGDVELGMTMMEVVCAWGRPDREQQQFISGGRKYAEWSYTYGEFDFESHTIEFINNKVVALQVRD